jgi:hypothetical protein
MRVSGPFAAFAAILLIPTACSSPRATSGAQVIAPPDAGADAAAAPVALGPLLIEPAGLTMGLYFTPTPKMDPKDALAKVCATQAKAFTRVDSMMALFQARGMRMEAHRNPADDALEQAAPEGISRGGRRRSSAAGSSSGRARRAPRGLVAGAAPARA